MTDVVFSVELCVCARSTEVNKNSKAKAKIRDASCEVRLKCHRPQFAILAGLGLAANLYKGYGLWPVLVPAIIW